VQTLVNMLEDRPEAMYDLQGPLHLWLYQNQMVSKIIYVVYKDYEVLFRGLIALHFLNGIKKIM
jgi:hypothetical protein